MSICTLLGTPAAFQLIFVNTNPAAAKEQPSLQLLTIELSCKIEESYEEIARSISSTWQFHCSANKDQPDASKLDTVRSRFGELMELANKHDLKALHEMFWQSSSALLVAKSAVPSEGNWAGFWGNEAIDQKLHDIAASGPAIIQPDYSKLKVVGVTKDVAGILCTGDNHGVLCGPGRNSQTISLDSHLDECWEGMESGLGDHPASSARACGQKLGSQGQTPTTGEAMQ